MLKKLIDGFLLIFFVFCDFYFLGWFSSNAGEGLDRIIRLSFVREIT